LSAAARAAQRKLSHVVLEATTRHANTIQRYQHRKHVMAEPGTLPLRSDIAFQAGRRESVLEVWEEGIRNSRAHIRYDAEVARVSGERGAFRIALKGGDLVRARHVILALGVQGNPRRLDVPGDELPCVQTFLDNAEDYQSETIVVVGAGDAAIENAIALCTHNRVILVNRRPDFPRAKDGNVARIMRALDSRQLECHFGAQTVRVEASPVDAPLPYRIVLRTDNGEREIGCHRVIARLGAVPPRGFVESIGVRFPDDQPDALPDLSLQYETSQPGVFAIGALAGCPLIKQAMNQGYEVIEHLSGNPLPPADHPVLEAILRPILAGRSVNDTLDAIRSQLPAFNSLKPKAMREVALASRVVAVRKGHRVFARGDYPSSVFHVLRGSIQLAAAEGTPMQLRTGQLLGEIGFVSGRPHEVAATAETDCMLLETPHATLSKVMRAEPAVRAYIDYVFVLRALKLFLLPHALPQTIFELSVGAQIHTMKAGDTLFEQGQPITRHHLLRRGSVTLSRQTSGADTPVAYCAAGSFIDVAACTPIAQARSVTARAVVAAETVSIDHASLVKLLATDEVLRRKVQEEKKQQLSGHARMSAQPEAGDVLSFLMSHGVGEATNVLVIDEQLCIGCDQCETACATTHEGVSRLDRRAGPSFYSLHLPTSCRHCEHPHCMQDCPPNAIHRLPDGEVFIDDTCIGCGNCEESCPYGVIQMAEIPQKIGLLDRLRGRRAAEAPKLAVKCDMCKDLSSGPACVNACPTGAAIRIHAEDVVSLARARAALAR
jgi:Fe-S-cluster-containing dehydrogenase component/thioredoxin reductase/CRP-like cAMP-binding protein